MGRRLKRPNEHTFSRRISDLVSIKGGRRIWGGDVWKECQAMNAGGEGVSHDLVAPRNAPNGDVEAREEGHVSARMATRYANSVGKGFGDLPGRRVVAGCG